MQNATIKPLSFLIGATMLALFCLVTCDDKPTEPKPAKDYVFYFNDGGYYDRYYRYFLATARVDSLIIPYESRYTSFAVSAHGTRLYLPDRYKTVVVSTDSFQVITEINHGGSGDGGGAAVSPDNRLVAIQGNDGLYILNTSDYSLVFHDTTKVINGIFSYDNSSFYASRWLNGVYRLSLADTLFQVTEMTFPYAIWSVVPSLNKDKWFMLVSYGQCVWSFEVYDVLLDSIIFRDSLFEYGYGDMILTLDGRFLFYTMPGTQLELCITAPYSAFTAFDVENNEIYKIISTAGIGRLPEFFPVGDLAMTPDGNKLLVVRGPVGGEFIVLDVGTMEIEKYFDLGNQVWLWDATCQNGL